MGLPGPEHPEPRRHHYVSRCWLRGFTEDGERDGRLWVTDFSRRAQWPSSPANAGHIRDFYRLGEDAPDPVAVETFFGTLETNAAPILRSIDAERRPPNNALCWVSFPRIGLIHKDAILSSKFTVLPMFLFQHPVSKIP